MLRPSTNMCREWSYNKWSTGVRALRPCAKCAWAIVKATVLNYSMSFKTERSGCSNHFHNNCLQATSYGGKYTTLDRCNSSPCAFMDGIMCFRLKILDILDCLDLCQCNQPVFAGIIAISRFVQWIASVYLFDVWKSCWFYLEMFCIRRITRILAFQQNNS